MNPGLGSTPPRNSRTYVRLRDKSHRFAAIKYDTTKAPDLDLP